MNAVARMRRRGAAWVLVAAALAVLVLVIVPLVHADTADLALVSRANGAAGADGNAASVQPDTTVDGHLVAFRSRATNLTADTVPGGLVNEAYVRDLTSGTTVLASRADGVGGAAASADVTNVSLSGDGRYVAFATQATNLVGGTTTSGVIRSYVRDLTTGTTVLVHAGANDDASAPVISADGTHLAFVSRTQPDGTQTVDPQVYERDLTSPASSGIVLVSRQDGANAPALTTGDQPSISATGEQVAFRGQAPSGVLGPQVWVRDTVAGTTVLASRASGTAGAAADSAADEPSISRDGSWVVFRSSASNLAPLNSGTKTDIYERDMAGTATILVSRADGASGAPGDDNSSSPTVSDDGRRVFFVSAANNLSTADNDAGDNGFVRDTLLGTTTWVHGGAAQSPPPQGVITGISLSGDGRYAAFDSNATLLGTSGETNSSADVFRRDLGAEPAAPAPPHLDIADAPAVSEGGAGATTPATFTITLSAAAARPVLVTWATSDGTATAADHDYQPDFGQLVFEPGETSKTVSVTVGGDTTFENDETFSVNLSSPDNATLGRGSATGTILNDDPAPPPPPPGGGSGGAGGAGGAGGGAGTGTGTGALTVDTGAPQADCNTEVVAQLLRFHGCFTSTSLQAGVGSVTLRGTESADATGRVTVDGLLLVPDDPKTKITVSPSLVTSFTKKVSVYAGPVKVFDDYLTLALPDATGKDSISPPSGFNPPSGSKLYGLDLTGEMALTFDRQGMATLKGPLAVPFTAGLVAPIDVTMQTTEDRGLLASAIGADVNDLYLGPVNLKQFSLTYDPINDIWAGSAKVVLPTPNRLLVGAGVAFQHGQFKSIFGEVDQLNFQITPGLFLQRIKLGVSVNPLEIFGGLGISAGPVVGGKTPVRVDGDFSYTFTNPGKLRVDGSLTLVDFKAATAFFEYLTSGSARFGGQLDIGLPDSTPSEIAKQPAQIHAYLNGFVDSQMFDVEVGASLVILKQPIHADLLVSSKGMAACGGVAFINAGFGYTWASQQLTLMGPFVCDVGDWRVFPAPRAVAAQAGGRTLQVSSRETILRLRGAGGVPKVTLSGPGGQSVTVPATDDPLVNNSFVVLQDPSSNTTYIALHHARGAWTLQLQPGSPAVSDVAGAAILPKPRVRASVRGKGRKRALRYTISPRAGQRVTFMEMGPQTRRTLGVARANRGTLRFAPGDGKAGTRQIVALVEQNGMPRAQLKVARYVAPGPPPVARAARLTLRPSGRSVRVSVKAGRGTAARYIVQVRFPSGSVVWHTLGAKAGTFTAIDGLPATGAIVRVQAQAADGRMGRAVSARAKAPKKAKKKKHARRRRKR